MFGDLWMHILPLFLLWDINFLAWVGTIAFALELTIPLPKQAPHPVEIKLPFAAMVKFAQILGEYALGFAALEHDVAMLAVVTMGHRAVMLTAIAILQVLTDGLG